MRVLVVCCDLRQRGKDYSEVFKVLMKSGEWLEVLDSTWLIYTEMTPKELYERLSDHLSETDRLFIVEAGKERFGCLSSQAWEWIDRRL